MLILHPTERMNMKVFDSSFHIIFWYLMGEAELTFLQAASLVIGQILVPFMVTKRAFYPYRYIREIMMTFML